MIEPDSNSIELELPGESSAELQELLKYFQDSMNTPLLLDSNYIQEKAGQEETKLSFEQLKQLTLEGFANSIAQENEYLIKAAIRIDSLKLINEYEAYVEKIDIGMIQEASSFGNGLLELTPNRKLLIWQINYKTYEACPFAEGSIVFGTLLENTEIGGTIQLAEKSSGGDPPAWNETFVHAEINENEIEQHKYQLFGEMNEDGENFIETTESNYRILIDSTGIVERELDLAP